MLYEIAADITALAHLTFIAFVVFGAFAGRRSRRWMALHMATMGYAILIEIFYWPCPLTALEQFLRRRAGSGEYQEAFIAHYINKLIYIDAPQWSLILAAAAVLAVNVGLYFYWWRNAGGVRRPGSDAGSYRGRIIK